MHDGSGWSDVGDSYSEDRPGRNGGWSPDRWISFLDSILATSADAIIGLEVDGTVSVWTRGAERLLGYAASEVMGRMLLDLVPVWTRHEWEGHLSLVSGGGTVEHAETVATRADGAPVPVSLTLAPALSPTGTVVALSACVRDRTEQELGLETLAEAARRLDEGEALAHVGAWALDGGRDEVQWSQELHRIHGVAPADFGGDLRSHLAPVHDDDRPDVETGIRRALNDGGRFEQEYRICRPNGSVRWVYATAVAVRDGSGQVAGLRGVGQDVTERREAADAVAEALTRERRATEELREADRAKDEFLATVSHELRTPLASILGFGQLAIDHGPTTELVEPIVRNAAQMHRMVERLLDFTRLEAGRVVYRPTTLRLADEVRRCIAALAGLTAGQPVDVDVDPSLCVVADADGLSRVLANLVGNALKFTIDGTPTHVRAGADGSVVVVSVADAGRGVPAELIEKVFERFFQAPDQPPGWRGTGVGLSIARRDVEAMGGRIWCEPGVPGAVFSFTVPRADP